MPNCRVALIDPVSSSTKPRNFTIAIDYDYPLTPDAYLIVRCKDSESVSTIYTHPITTTTGATPLPQIVSHDSNFENVEIEARICTTEEWGGTVLASSLSDDVDIVEKLRFSEPLNDFKEKYKDAWKPGFLSEKEVADYFRALSEYLKANKTIGGTVDSSVLPGAMVHAVVYARRKPRPNEMPGGNKRKFQPLCLRPIKVKNGEIKDGKWSVELPQGALSKASQVVFHFTYETATEKDLSLTMSIALPK
jgi:hypothetical protein